MLKFTRFLETVKPTKQDRRALLEHHPCLSLLPLIPPLLFGAGSVTSATFSRVQQLKSCDAQRCEFKDTLVCT